jgi:hypothetical protein
MQFLDACRGICSTNPDTSTIISQLRFIVACTKNSVDYVDLANDAKNLLNRIEIPFMYPGLTSTKATNRFYVPYLRPEKYVKWLETKVTDATIAESQLESLSRTRDLEKLTQYDLKTIIDVLGKSSLGFINLSEANATAIAALSDLNSKLSDMQRYNKDVELKKTLFKQGVAKYEAQQVSSWILFLAGANRLLMISDK